MERERWREGGREGEKDTRLVVCLSKNGRCKSTLLPVPQGS